MRFRVLVVGRSKCRWANEAVSDYTQRLRRHGGVDELAVRQVPFRGDVEAVRSAEATRLLDKVGPRDRLIALDERGLRVDTSGFTELVDEGRQAGTVVFALGGPYGHGPEVRKRAWKVVRLSELVLNHEVARVLLYEQLYRSMTLISGVPYHH